MRWRYLALPLTFLGVCFHSGSGHGPGSAAPGPLAHGVRQEEMKEASGSPSISLGMFIRPLPKKIRKSVYKMECQEHCVKEHLSGRL